MHTLRLSRDMRQLLPGLRVVAVCIGVFLIAMSLNKLGWLRDSQLLTERFDRWVPAASVPTRWYLEHIAIPGGPVFARLVPVGEFTTGLALVLGVRSRAAALVALFMVLNFHFATGSLFDLAFFRDGTGLPVLGGLLAIAISPAERSSHGRPGVRPAPRGWSDQPPLRERYGTHD